MCPVPIAHLFYSDCLERLLASHHWRAVGMARKSERTGKPHRVPEHVIAKHCDVRQRHGTFCLEVIRGKRRILNYVAEESERLSESRGRNRDRPPETIASSAR